MSHILQKKHGNSLIQKSLIFMKEFQHIIAGIIFQHLTKMFSDIPSCPLQRLISVFFCFLEFRKFYFFYKARTTQLIYALDNFEMLPHTVKRQCCCKTKIRKTETASGEIHVQTHIMDLRHLVLTKYKHQFLTEININAFL